MLEREQAECAAAVARKEEDVVDLLQEQARDRASIADKEMLAQEQACLYHIHHCLYCGPLQLAYVKAWQVRFPAESLQKCTGQGHIANNDLHAQEQACHYPAHTIIQLNATFALSGLVPDTVPLTDLSLTICNDKAKACACSPCVIGQGTLMKQM